MGRRRRDRKNARQKWFDDSDHEMKPVKLSQTIYKKSLHQRWKSKERKKKLKKGKVEFKNKLHELDQAEPLPEQLSELPTSLSSFTPSPDVAQLISNFLNRKTNILEQKQGVVYTPNFYCDNCSVTVHSAPYLTEKYNVMMEKNVGNKKNCKSNTNVDSMLPYVLASSNLLKGSWPLPSWALDFDNGEAKGKLDKMQSKKLHVIHKIQDFNSRYFKRQQKHADISELSHFDATYATICAAVGLPQVQKLFETLPLLLTIKSDVTTCYDIIDHGPTGVCFHYRTLCLEMPREQSKNKTSVLLHAPLVRWVHKTVILLPPPNSKIINEMICITPVSEEQQAKYADIIRDSIESWVANFEKTGFDSTSLSRPEKCEKALMINHISSVTGMNQFYSEQCLNECDWDVQTALEAFRRVQAAGNLPENAFA